MNQRLHLPTAIVTASVCVCMINLQEEESVRRHNPATNFIYDIVRVVLENTLTPTQMKFIAGFSISDTYLHVLSLEIMPRKQTPGERNSAGRLVSCR